MRGTINVLIIVITMPTGRTLSKPTQELVMNELRHFVVRISTMQVQTSHSHFKREVNVHRGDGNVEAPNECVKGKFKLKNKFTLSKHRGD